MSDKLLEQLINKEDERKRKIFEFQLECLKIEMDLIDRDRARRETVTQNVKNYAIVGWAAAISIFLGQVELRPFVLFTATVPLIFWFVDGWWLYLYRGTTLRSRKMRTFLNSDDLRRSFERQELVNFTLMDVSGRQYRGSREYKKYVNFGRVLLFREMIFLYGGLILISSILGIITTVAL